jgi:hypothetical protein
MDIDCESTKQWRESTVKTATSQLREDLKQALANPAPTQSEPRLSTSYNHEFELTQDAASQPSACVASMLDTLLKSVRHIGPCRSQQSSSLVSSLLQDLRQQLQDDLLPQHIRNLQELPKARRSAFVSQTQTDLAYLKEVLQRGLGREGEDSIWSDAFEQLAEVCAGLLNTHIPSNPLASQLATPVDQLAELSLQSFQRSQNLLASLLPTTFQSAHPSDTSRLLPYGQSTGAIASDTKLELAKPGPRFTLLPLNATAA